MLARRSAPRRPRFAAFEGRRQLVGERADAIFQACRPREQVRSYPDRRRSGLPRSKVGGNLLARGLTRFSRHAALANKFAPTPAPRRPRFAAFEGRRQLVDERADAVFQASRPREQVRSYPDRRRSGLPRSKVVGNLLARGLTRFSRHAALANKFAPTPTVDAQVCRVRR